MRLKKYGDAITWQRGKGYGVVDTNGNIMIFHKYRRPWRRADTSYIACNCRNKYGLLDSCSNELIPLEYDYLESLHPDRFSARQGEYWFVINRSGQRLSEKSYDYLGCFTESEYAILEKNKWMTGLGGSAWDMALLIRTSGLQYPPYTTVCTGMTMTGYLVAMHTHGVEDVCLGNFGNTE